MLLLTRRRRSWLGEEWVGGIVVVELGGECDETVEEAMYTSLVDFSIRRCCC